MLDTTLKIPLEFTLDHICDGYCAECRQIVKKIRCYCEGRIVATQKERAKIGSAHLKDEQPNDLCLIHYETYRVKG